MKYLNISDLVIMSILGMVGIYFVNYNFRLFFNLFNKGYILMLLLIIDKFVLLLNMNLRIVKL